MDKRGVIMSLQSHNDKNYLLFDPLAFEVISVNAVIDYFNNNNNQIEEGLVFSDFTYVKGAKNYCISIEVVDFLMDKSTIKWITSRIETNEISNIAMDFHKHILSYKDFKTIYPNSTEYVRTWKE